MRFEHTHVLGGTGAGKTSLLATQILDDLRSDNPPAIIVIDGKGKFVRELQHLKVIGDLSKRLTIINPQDISAPPALNLFVPPLRPGMPPEVAQQVTESAISNFAYIFSARDFAVTEKQEICLSYCVRLLYTTTPVSTIINLLDLLSDPPVKTVGGLRPDSPFKHLIDSQQEPIVQRFFKDAFYSSEYAQTRQQIQSRIYGLVGHPAFRAMFTATECKLDLFRIMQNREILLVDSSSSALGEKAAPVLGRYILALALSSAYARLELPEREWNPVYIIIDEAQMFVDEEKTQPLLQQARGFNIGVTLAHQKLADLTPTLSATLAANTSIKYAGGTNAIDAAFMAKNMNCEPEFIMDMQRRKTPTTRSFASFIKGHTEKAIAVAVPVLRLKEEPKLTTKQHERLIARNREKVSPLRLVAHTPTPPQTNLPTTEPNSDQEPKDPTTPKSPKGKKRW
ncbi:MAG: type IV secretion system DNA-binding domain-containing protein [Fimbriimonadaceae bacterium]